MNASDPMRSDVTEVMPAGGPPTPPYGTAMPAAGGAPPPDARRRRRRWPRWVLLGVFAVVGLAVIYFAVSLYDVWAIGRHDEARPVDAIVVMGAAQYDGTPSPQLASRLDHALDLYKRGLAPRVFVTGGKQPLDRFTEAASEARYLQDGGVPASAILREVDGRTSWQSLTNVAAQMKAQGLHSVLLVSDPYHLARIKGMAQELGLTAYVSATHTSPVTGFAAFRHDVQEAAGVGVARIIGYAHFEDLFG